MIDRVLVIFWHETDLGFNGCGTGSGTMRRSGYEPGPSSGPPWKRARFKGATAVMLIINPSLPLKPKNAD